MAYRSLLLSLDDIDVPSGRRAVNRETVKTLAESIKRIGLRQPISVTSPVKNRYRLITGAHRLEAVRANGDHMILSSVMDVSELDARLWEISENLHRADLSKLERSEQVAEWVRLTEDKRAKAQVAPWDHTGGRADKGINAAVRDLGIDRTEAQRSVKIAGIAPEAKEAAREAGLDDNQSALLKIAAAPVERQAEVVATIVTERASRPSRAPVAPVEPAPAAVVVVDDIDLVAIVKPYEGAASVARWRELSLYAAERTLAA